MHCWPFSLSRWAQVRQQHSSASFARCGSVRSPSVGKAGVWTPAPLSDRNRAGNYALIGRINPGANMDHMEGPIRSIAASLGKRFRYPPAWDKTRSPGITPIREHVVGKVRLGLLATFAAM